MVPILTYHSVGTLNPILDTPVEKFEQHLKSFAENGYNTINSVEFGAADEGEVPAT